MKTFLSVALVITSLTSFAQNMHEYKVISTDDINETVLINSSESHPEDGQAHFNLAAHYYNQGVWQIDHIDNKASDDELKTIQDNVQRLFRIALPSALKAHELNSSSAKTCEMLSGIYFGLNDLPKAEEFSAKARSLSTH
ncbi:MAG: hypothetical protein R2813_12885 [Flavobacteriales bacterium]